MPEKPPLTCKKHKHSHNARDIIDVYSNSWGPSDTGYNVSGPRNLTKLAFENGITYVRRDRPFSNYIVYSMHIQGHNGKGSVYVWASGDGGEDDDCAADGYVPSNYTLLLLVLM